MKKSLSCLTLMIFSFFLGSQLKAQSPGNALDFDGINDIVNCPLPAIFTDIPNSSFTVEAWVKPEAVIFSRILFAQHTTSNFASLSTGNLNQLYFYVVKNGVTYSVATNASLPLNQWTHVAATWNPGTNQLQVYFNGVIQAGIGGGSSSTGSNGMMSIGSRPGGFQYFPGEIDEVRIWNSVRSACDIQGAMNSELTGTETGLVAYYDFDHGVAGGNNAGITTLIDYSPGGNDGTLANFTLNGNASNWVASGADIFLAMPNSNNIYDTITICQGDTVILGTQTLTVSGDYVEIFVGMSGCDSTVNLSLFVAPVDSINDQAEICGGDSLIFGFQVLTLTGTYVETFQNMNGCDSVVTLFLQVHNGHYTLAQASICEGDSYIFGSQTLTTAGVYLDAYTNIFGCDSIISLTLTVDTVDAGISLNGTILSANASGAMYQWIDCNNGNAIIPGETNQQYTVTSTGSYAVIVTQNGCSDTSVCQTVSLLGMEDLTQTPLKVFPNPNNGQFTLYVPAAMHVRILDITGRPVYNGKLQEGNHAMDLQELIPGTYFIQGEGTAVISFIKIK